MKEVLKTVKMEKENKFKQEIRKISINHREEQIISIVEEKFDEFIYILKEENQKKINEMKKELEKLQYHQDHITCPECNLCGTCESIIKPLEKRYRAFIEFNDVIDKFTGDKLID